MSVRPDRQFSIRYNSYKGYRAVTLLGELYFVTTGDKIGAITGLWITNHAYLDYEPRIFGFHVIIGSPPLGLSNGPKFHHRWIILQKDCFTSGYPLTVIYLDYMWDFSGLRFGNISPLHWGQPHEATVVKMVPTRPLASRSFCLLVLLCDHRSLSNLQQRNTEAWYNLHKNDRLVSVLVFVQWSPKDSPRDDGRQICPK